jgi:hypothetical protein
MTVLMRVESSPSEHPTVRGHLDAVRAREAGLHLVSRARRWMIGGAVGLAAALTALTSHAYHARATPTSSAVGSASVSESRSVGRNTSTGNTTPLQSPSSAPAAAAPAPAPVAPVVSGGS